MRHRYNLTARVRFGLPVPPVRWDESPSAAGSRATCRLHFDSKRDSQASRKKGGLTVIFAPTALPIATPGDLNGLAAFSWVVGSQRLVRLNRIIEE